MNAQTIGWFVFLAILKNCAYAAVYFKLDDSNLTAVEGSCIEIKCKVTYKVSGAGYWFWMKDRKWDQDKGDFNATIIYSTNELIRPVNPNYASRVKYTGSPPSSWIASQNSASKTHPACNILICDLNKTDSGNYSLRFIGIKFEKWATEEVNLTVTENPCPITFEKPSAVKASDQITLTCSTLSSCPSDPEIKGQTPSYVTPEKGNVTRKSTTVSFRTGWQDDGREFSCQARNNKDVYLIQNINITVEYAPLNVLAEKSLTDIKEGESVTLTCSAIGRPDPTFTWRKDGVHRGSGPKLTFQSIGDSDSGEYRCEATNRHRTVESNTVSINVTYAPEVEIKMTPSVPEVKQGDEITFICNVKRSNPKPDTFAWFKNGSPIDWRTSRYVRIIEARDHGPYTCTATNTVGTGTSEGLTLTVLYAPMETTISIFNQKEKVDQPLKFYCMTRANPEPTTYSWYRYCKDKKTNSLQWTSRTTHERELSLDRVQRADEACYTCNATNSIDTGRNSGELCIKVRYPPSKPMLSLDTDVREGQHITIKCTVDSYPPSDLKLTSPSNARQFMQTYEYNTLQHSFNATSTDAGVYTCIAKCEDVTVTSTPRTLVVRYRPNNVKVEAEHGLTVTENTALKLRCTANSHPAVTSYTWMKMVNGKPEIIRNHQKQTMEISATPSDSGNYSCGATNEMGTGRSERVEVKVRYAPRNTMATHTAEKQQGEISYVTLTCSSESYPASNYSWYRKTNDKRRRDEKVSIKRSHVVSSDKPGLYYCIANNEISQSRSEEVGVFVEKIYVKVLKFFGLFLLILLVICFLVIYRRKRSKTIRQGTTNTTPCFGFLGWRNCGRRRDLMNEPVMAEPFRSRDDLLADQTGRPHAHGRQPLPDSTPAPNITSVYYTVNLPNGKQGPSAQKPIKQQGGHTEDESLNYASIHFENKKKNKPIKAEENPVYAMVAKQKPPKKNEQHGPEDYENISAAHAAKSTNPSNDDTDTSDSEDEDEVELNYAKVSFKAKPGHKRDRKDSSSSTSSETSSSTSSSTSDDEETQYSQVKVRTNKV